MHGELGTLCKLSSRLETGGLRIQEEEVEMEHDEASRCSS